MKQLYRSPGSERAIRERYLEFLKHWPVANRQFRVPTRQGETFVIVCGDEHAPPLLLLHGSLANSLTWMANVVSWAQHFRIYVVDMIGEPGLSAPARPPLDSDAYALWLDDVLMGLSVAHASIAGVSLGGWLALDYATRRPERVESLSLLCPGGVGRQQPSFPFKALGLAMLGPWGKRKLREMILGRASAKLPPAAQKFSEFMALIQQNFRPRKVKLPIFSDDALARLTMPVLVIIGGRDILLDSEETRRRLAQHVPHAEIRYLPEARHFIPGQTATVLDFLRRSVAQSPNAAGYRTVP